MSFIHITKQTKNELLRIKINEDDCKSFDDAVNILLDSASSASIDNTRTSMRLKDSTLARLKEFKAYPTESNNDILYRLLLSYQD